MAGLTKTEGGQTYPSHCFLDRRDPKKPATWGLRTHELVHGELVPTKEQLNKASAALLSGAYMGGRTGASKPGQSYEELRRKLVSKYREIGVPDESLPKGLLPKGSTIVHAKRKDPNFIEHYGVKGMKWGIRRDRSSKGSSPIKKAKGMTDEELSTAISRMQIEQQYASLVSKDAELNKGRIERGKDAVVKQLKIAGQEQMKNVMSLALKSGTKKALESEQFRDIVAAATKKK